MDSLENHQALAKQFALILDFVLAFDDLKVLFLILILKSTRITAFQYRHTHLSHSQA